MWIQWPRKQFCWRTEKVTRLPSGNLSVVGWFHAFERYRQAYRSNRRLLQSTILDRVSPVGLEPETFMLNLCRCKWPCMNSSKTVMACHGNFVVSSTSIFLFIGRRSLKAWCFPSKYSDSLSFRVFGPTTQPVHSGLTADLTQMVLCLRLGNSRIPCCRYRRTSTLQQFSWANHYFLAPMTSPYVWWCIWTSCVASVSICLEFLRFKCTWTLLPHPTPSEKFGLYNIHNIS